MLDEEDRELLVVADLADERHELERLLRVHPGGRLVEEQELRLRRERARHLEPALVAVREVPRVVVVTPCEAAVVEQLEGALTGLALLPPDAGRADDAAEDPSLETAVHADEDVLERRHLLEQPDVLERPPDAALGRRVGRHAGDVLVLEDDRARRRLVDARDHVEERRLAGAVRADQADDRAPLDREVDVVDGDEAAELLAELLDLEEKVACHPYPSGA